MLFVPASFESQQFEELVGGLLLSVSLLLLLLRFGRVRHVSGPGTPARASP
jgi:hypothetical protein